MIKPGFHFRRHRQPPFKRYAEAQRFSIVREYCGHGIGRIFHEDPQVLHYGIPQALEKFSAQA